MTGQQNGATGRKTGHITKDMARRPALAHKMLRIVDPCQESVLYMHCGDDGDRSDRGRVRALLDIGWQLALPGRPEPWLEGGAKFETAVRRRKGQAGRREAESLAELALAQAKIRDLRQRVFGRKSERGKGARSVLSILSWSHEFHAGIMCVAEPGSQRKRRRKPTAKATIG